MKRKTTKPKQKGGNKANAIEGRQHREENERGNSNGIGNEKGKENRTQSKRM
jgi:hypothetical protein